MAGGNVWEGLWKGALFGGVAGAAGGYLQHVGFRNAVFDSDKYIAARGGGGDGAAAIAFERSVPEVIIQGIKQYAGTGLRVVGNGLKILATVPLMTLAFVLTPTELGSAHRPAPSIQQLLSQGKFKGGAQKQRDNDYGYFKDKEFKDWWHREGKRKWGGQDFNEDNAEDIYQEWKDLGKPRGGGNKKNIDNGKY